MENGLHIAYILHMAESEMDYCMGRESIDADKTVVAKVLRAS